MGILLVHPSSDAQFQNFEAVPPLGLITLYSKLPDYIKVRTKLLDGDIVSSSYIKEWIKKNKPDIVGISTLTFNYQNAIDIAGVAKENNSVVVIGGRHATDVLPNIIRRMRMRELPFNYVVSGEGELVFRDLILDFYENGSISPKRNLFSVRRLNEGLNVLPERRYGTDSDFPVLDYSILVDESSPEEYMKKLGKIGILSKVKISMPIISQRGCAYTGEKSHCKFCSIPRVNPRLPLEIFERSLENLIKTTNADHIWITEGDFTASIKHVHMVGEGIKKVKERTGNDFLIYCFSRADEILREGMTGKLFDMGVRSVFIGYEHGNDMLLRKMCKNTTRNQNIEATKRLMDSGIEVICGGIVLGTPSETRQTLGEAIEFAIDLADTGNIKSILASIIYPLPNAPYWEEFLNAVGCCDHGLGDKLRTLDVLDMEYL